MWETEDLKLLGWFLKIYIRARNINKSDIDIANLDDHLNYNRLTVKELFYLTELLNLDLECLRQDIDNRPKDESNNDNFHGYKFQRMPVELKIKAQEEIGKQFEEIYQIEKDDKSYIAGELIKSFGRGYLLDGLFEYVFGDNAKHLEIYVQQGFNRSEKLSGCFSIINSRPGKKIDFSGFIKRFINKYILENKEEKIMLNATVKDYQKIGLDDMLKLIGAPSVGRAARVYAYSRALYFNDLGERKYDEFDYQKALRCFNTALKIYDNDEIFYYSRSPIGNRPKVESNEEIIDKNVILFNRARILNNIGEKELALNDLKLIMESEYYNEYSVEERIQIESLLDEVNENH